MREPKTGRVVSFLLIVAMLITMIPPVQAATPEFIAEQIDLSGVVHNDESLEEKLKEAKKKKEELEKKKKQVANETSKLKAEYDSIEKYIEEMDAKQSEMMLEITALEEALDELNAELEITNKQLAEAERVEAEQYETLKRRFQYLYEHGNISELEVLLGSQDVTGILNYEQYASSIRAYDYRLAKNYTAAKNEVAAVKERLEIQISVLESSRELYDEDFKYIQEVIAKKEEAMADYEAKIGINEDILEDYTEDILKAGDDVNKVLKEIEAERKRKEAEEAKRRAEEAKRLAEEQKRLAQQQSQQQQAEREKKYANVPHTGVSSASQLTLKDERNVAKMIWPLPGDSRMGAGFGPRRAPVKGASTFHKGVDIGAAYGAQIVASLAGTVVFAGYNSSAGNYVEIDHGNGYHTRYLHCSKLLVSKGDKVLQGQVIALVGSTGVSTAPHLHFTVTIDGTSVDPLLYVRY